MKRVIVLIAVASLAYGIQYNGLRVKVGWSDALVDIDYFYHIPRTIGQAEKESWKRVDRDDSYLPELRLYCLMKSKGVCALYDVGGFVAGLQISLPKDQFEPPQGVKPEQRFKRWTVSANNNDGENYREYWTVSQYFVSPESLTGGAGPTLENGRTLQDGGVWVKGLDDKIMKIPTSESELNNTLFRKQNCIPNMGTHYYYNMSSQQKCENVLPFFALVTEGQLVGVGFQYFGRLRSQPHRDWFETVPFPAISIKATTPYAPSCMTEWAEAYGIISLHIYFIDKPWYIRCKTGDSIKPGPPQDRFVVNAARYASAVSDQIKKLFVG